MLGKFKCLKDPLQVACKGKYICHVSICRSESDVALSTLESLSNYEGVIKIL